MSTTWRVEETDWKYGHSDWQSMTLMAPRGDMPVDKAIRAHEALHIIYSPKHKPWRYESWEWLEDARIDWMVEDFGPEYRQGIRAFRQSDVNQWLRYGKKTRRNAAKCAIIGRGYQVENLFTEYDDRVFIAKMLAKLSSNPDNNDIINMAKALEEWAPPDQPKEESKYTGLNPAIAL